MFPDQDVVGNVNNVLPRRQRWGMLLASLGRSFLSSVFLGSGTAHSERYPPGLTATRARGSLGEGPRN